MLHILDFIYRVSSNFDHIVLRKNFTLFFFLEKKKLDGKLLLSSLHCFTPRVGDGRWSHRIFFVPFVAHLCACAGRGQRSTSRVSLPYSSQLNQELAHTGHWEWPDCSRALLCLSCPQITCDLPHPPNMSRGSEDLNSGNADWVWWYTPRLLHVGRLRQEDHEFENRVVYTDSVSKQKPPLKSISYSRLNCQLGSLFLFSKDLDVYNILPSLLL